MTEHYPASTESVTRWCNQCGRGTQHTVSGGRVGRCLEHDAPQFSKKQIAEQSRRERHGDQELRGEIEVRAGEGLGRNITTQLLKAPQLEGLAPCGNPKCAGCYWVGIDWAVPGADRAVEVRIHPPRSEW